MKVHAHFPTACRPEQAVQAPPERPSSPRTSGNTPSAVRTARADLADAHSLPSALSRRPARAFPTTRPHDFSPSDQHGIVP